MKSRPSFDVSGRDNHGLLPHRPARWEHAYFPSGPFARDALYRNGVAPTWKTTAQVVPNGCHAPASLFLDTDPGNVVERADILPESILVTQFA